LDQGLRLRGSRVFDNVDAYEAFVGQIVQRFNARVAKGACLALPPMAMRRSSLTNSNS
jgi:hypothetical protein